MKPILALPLMLAACAGRLDNAGYQLPTGSLENTVAMVVVVPQKTVQGVSGLKQRVNAVTVPRTPTTDNAASCVVYLYDHPESYAALEHELWHCKNGKWHK